MNEVRFDKYRLLERISHGGMAEVFRAKTFGAAGFEREVAIKLLLPTVAMDREFITMLIDEAKIAGQLSHANIAQIFDLGMAEGRYYIVQEYVAGRDLRAIIRRCRSLKQPLTVPQACHIMLKVCEGLDYAHNKRDSNGQPLNLVHRDVSPQNVLVSMDGQVKLIDFGIAKAEGRATRTLAGLVKGKFAYMSPEQIRGLPVDRRSDVFACGIVFHELLTAKPLFLRKSEFETLKRARSGEILPPSESNPAVPDTLDKIVLQSLARHVDDRFQSAQALREALWDFVKSSGQFYSQGQLADWMGDTFGVSEDTHTAVTTERDQQLKSYDDFTPTGDETGRTADGRPQNVRPQPGAEFMGIPVTPRPNFADADASQTVPEIPSVGRRRPSGRHRSDFGLPTEEPTAVEGGRAPTSPSPFALADAHRRGDTGVNPALDPGSSVRRANAFVAPSPHIGGKVFPGAPPGVVGEDTDPDLDNRDTSRPDQRGSLPLPAEQTAPPTANRLIRDEEDAPYSRTSRHSMRVLTSYTEEDEEDSPKRRSTNLIVAAVLFVLLLAGAAAATLSFIGGDDKSESTETRSE